MTDPTAPPLDRCRSCGAEIRWVKTPAGKAMPLDAKPEKRWVVRVRPDGKGGWEWAGEMTDTYVSHYATCPQAGRWRGEKREGR